MNLWKSVDRWGPGAIALVTLLALIGGLWYLGERTSRIEGEAATLHRVLEQRLSVEVALRAEVQTWQAYTVRLQTRMIEAKMTAVPDPPSAHRR